MEIIDHVKKCAPVGTPPIHRFNVYASVRCAVCSQTAVSAHEATFGCFAYTSILERLVRDRYALEHAFTSLAHDMIMSDQDH